jgi:hypothetical protein
MPPGWWDSIAGVDGVAAGARHREGQIPLPPWGKSQIFDSLGLKWRNPDSNPLFSSSALVEVLRSHSLGSSCEAAGKKKDGLRRHGCLLISLFQGYQIDTVGYANFLDLLPLLD